MKLRIKSYKGAKKPSRNDLDISGRFDMVTFISAAVAFVIAILYVVYTGATNPENHAAMLWLALPFFACGVVYHMRTRFWILPIAAVVCGAMWFLELSPYLLLLALFISIAIPGTTSLADALQRWAFYRTLCAVEYSNVRASATFVERTVAFIFKVPENIDTRNISLEQDMARGRMPWKDVRRTAVLGLVFGMFVWIVLSLNQSALDLSTADDILATHMTILMLTLYIPAIMMPWAVFRSLDVKIETSYRDYRFYNGITSTIKTMALPILAAFLLVFLYAGPLDHPPLTYYILFSAAMTVVVTAVASMLYHAAFEAKLVNDVMSKWKTFSPTPLFTSLEEKTACSAEDVPGTPERNLGDFGKLILPGNR
ncbi:MAG: hypothetical protein LBS92_08090 [Candidatus Methanoplasma sp.]|nr:hypothetical protein [Candidatus Methanoplasma sp.]